MSWRRVARIMLFDLRYRIATWQGLFFFVPFLLLWYPLLRKFDHDMSTFLSEREGFLVAAKFLDPQTANALFIEHPPLLSISFLIMLYTAPFFAILAGYDQFASDLGNGFLRFLSSRCLRFELFLGRYLSAFCMLAGAYFCAALAAAAVSVHVEHKPLGDVLLYIAQILLTTLLYTAPFLAFASIASTLTRSAAGALFLGMAGYVLVLFIIFVGNTLWPDPGLFSFLLPSGVRLQVFGVNALVSAAAVASLPLYTLAYGWTAWSIFRLRNY